MKTSPLCILALLFQSSISSIDTLLTSLPDKPTQIFHDYTGHASYQDQIVNGKVIEHGRVTHLQERYDALNEIIKQYDRPITVLDLGAAQGYYSFKLAHTYKNSTFIMVEEDPYLLKLCLLNDKLNNIIFLQKRISIEELRRLGECEHFDVVIAFNIIHWAEEKWQETTDAILHLGDNILIETPPKGDKAFGEKYLGEIENYLENKKASIILQTPRHTGSGLHANMYRIEQNKNLIKRADWISPIEENTYYITSSLKEKKLIIPVDENSQPVEAPLTPGINWLTFKSLNGVYPLQETLETSLIKQNVQTTNLLFSPIIVQGNTLLPLENPLKRKTYKNKEKKDNYRLSILTSLYKGQEFIEGFLADITQQTIFNECELIIINAASPENEETIIKKYMETFPNIVYKKLEKDPGLFGVWNMGIKMARSPYLTNANVDDRLKHDCYETHLHYLDEHQNIDLVYSACYDTFKSNETFEKNSSNGKIIPHTQLDFDRKKQLFNWIPYVNNHPIWRKSLHQKYGLFHEGFDATGGMDFWIRATICGSAHFKRLPGVYGLFYRNPKAISKRATDKTERNQIENFYKKIWKEYYKNVEFLSA